MARKSTAKKPTSKHNTPLWYRIQKGLLWLILLFFASSILVTVIYKWVPVYYTPLMGIRCIQQKMDGKETKCKHHWVSLDDSISRYMPIAVMASEDQRFLTHNGFDLNAIGDALKDKAAGKRQRGGSTISQQTAKNVYLWPHSDWVRKGFEVYFTFLIEHIWGKHRIMEVYLNSIEMGDGIYGAEAVARENFRCTAKELSRSECALIAATLPNPRKYSSKDPSSYMRKRKAQIGLQMKHIDVFPKDK